ncbi:MAG: hypothetical protein BroJett025_00870 [Patescibacteria group bacterium]|nr:MAG: hypothetical protein BroJett025_00870 [Patescibacteria group bacterium]
MDDTNQISDQVSAQDDAVQQAQPTSQQVASAPTPTSAAANPSGGGTQKNPLDVLEQLLSEIDGGKTGNATPAKPSGPTPEEIAAQKAAEELEQRRIEYEQKQAQQQVIDQEKIDQQRQALVEEMSNGTANVARAQQDEQKKIEQEEKQQAEEGFEIVQLDHTKI